MKKAMVFGILALLIHDAAHSEEGLTNKQFLNFSEGQKHWWYAGAFEAFGHMVYLQDEKKAQCVWTWMTTKPEEKKSLLESSFKAYPEYTPSGTILALLQRDCGEFKVN